MTTLGEKLVKLRKDRRCWGCNDPYYEGMYLLALTQASEGTVFTTYWCETCTAYWRKYMQDSDGIMQGDLAGEQHYQEFKQNRHD
jgi:hypothetical protein